MLRMTRIFSLGQGVRQVVSPLSPGGGVPPGHVNETDKVTCHCPHTHTGRGEDGGGWFGRDWNVVKEFARRLLADSSNGTAHAFYVISGGR